MQLRVYILNKHFRMCIRVLKAFLVSLPTQLILVANFGLIIFDSIRRVASFESVPPQVANNALAFF